MIKAKIEEILNKSFQPSFLEVIDESAKHAGHAGASQGGHFRVHIVSKHFEGKKLIDSHRMIYKVLEPVKSSIHALAVSAKADRGDT